MDTTTGELIFYIVAIIIAIIFLIAVHRTPSKYINITWGQRRDWEREEKRWRK